MASRVTSSSSFGSSSGKTERWNSSLRKIASRSSSTSSGTDTRARTTRPSADESIERRETRSGRTWRLMTISSAASTRSFLSRASARTSCSRGGEASRTVAAHGGDRRRAATSPSTRKTTLLTSGSFSSVSKRVLPSSWRDTGGMRRMITSLRRSSSSSAERLCAPAPGATRLTMAMATAARAGQARRSRVVVAGFRIIFLLSSPRAVNGSGHERHGPRGPEAAARPRAGERPRSRAAPRGRNTSRYWAPQLVRDLAQHAVELPCRAHREPTAAGSLGEPLEVVAGGLIGGAEEDGVGDHPGADRLVEDLLERIVAADVLAVGQHDQRPPPAQPRELEEGVDDGVVQAGGAARSQPRRGMTQQSGVAGERRQMMQVVVERLQGGEIAGLGDLLEEPLGALGDDPHLATHRARDVHQQRDVERQVGQRLGTLDGQLPAPVPQAEVGALQTAGGAALGVDHREIELGQPDVDLLDAGAEKQHVLGRVAAGQRGAHRQVVGACREPLRQRAAPGWRGESRRRPAAVEAVDPIDRRAMRQADGDRHMVSRGLAKAGVERPLLRLQPAPVVGEGAAFRVQGDRLDQPPIAAAADEAGVGRVVVDEQHAAVEPELDRVDRASRGAGVQLHPAASLGRGRQDLDPGEGGQGDDVGPGQVRVAAGAPGRLRRRRLGRGHLKLAAPGDQRQPVPIDRPQVEGVVGRSQAAIEVERHRRAGVGAGDMVDDAEAVGEMRAAIDVAGDGHPVEQLPGPQLAQPAGADHDPAVDDRLIVEAAGERDLQPGVGPLVGVAGRQALPPLLQPAARGRRPGDSAPQLFERSGPPPAARAADRPVPPRSRGWTRRR